jgi:hypothetical protein
MGMRNWKTCKFLCRELPEPSVSRDTRPGSPHFASGCAPDLRADLPYPPARCSAAQCGARNPDDLSISESRKPRPDSPLRPSYSRSQTIPVHPQRQHFGFRGIGFEDDGKNARRSGEIALPEFMPGRAFQCRMQHAFNLRPSRQPARNLQGRGLDVLQSHRHGPHAAQGQTAIVRRGRIPQKLLRRS